MWKPKPCPSLSHDWNRNAAKRGVFGPWGIFRKHIGRQTCLGKPVCSTFVRVSSCIKTLVAPQNLPCRIPERMDKAPHGRRIWESAGQDLIESPAFQGGFCVRAARVRLCLFDQEWDDQWQKHHETSLLLEQTETWAGHDYNMNATFARRPAALSMHNRYRLSLFGKLFHVIPIKSFPKAPVHQRNLMASVVSTWTSPSGCRSETIADQTPDHRPQLSVPIIHGISLDL